MFLSDIDFLPMFGLYLYLKKMIISYDNDITKKVSLFLFVFNENIGVLTASEFIRKLPRYCIIDGEKSRVI